MPRYVIGDALGAKIRRSPGRKVSATPGRGENPGSGSCMALFLLSCSADSLGAGFLQASSPYDLCLAQTLSAPRPLRKGGAHPCVACRDIATGGLGGVHRGANESFDESADLTALSQLDMTIVCAGVKSILDVHATLERLETLAIGLVGYKTNSFPGFYLTDSGYTLEHRVDSPEEIAAIIRARKAVSTHFKALVVANPVVKEMPKGRHDEILASGLARAKSEGIDGKLVTPFLLEHFHTASKGESLAINTEIIKSNCLLAAQIAVALK